MRITPCFTLKLRQAARVLTNHYDSYLRELGITVTQFSILRSLWYMKSTPQKDLQEVLVLQQTTLTRNLKPLIRSGYIQTCPCPNDGRVTLVSLTAEGEALFQEARKYWKQAQDSVTSKLGGEVSEQLLQVTDAIIDLR